MTRAEYKQMRDAYRRAVREGWHYPSRLQAEIIDYEWAHGLRYVVWSVKRYGERVVWPDMHRAVDRKHALACAKHERANGLRVRITRAVRKPAGSP